MTHPSHLIEEERLRAALAAERRPQSDFVEAVHDKLRAREDSGQSEPRRSLKAASIAPLLFVSLPKAGTATGSKVSWKLVPVVAALPVVALLMLFATFYYGVRAVRQGHPETALEIWSWWRRNLTVVAIIAALLVTLFFVDAMFAISMALMISMLMFVVILGTMGRLGKTSRAAIAANTFPWLFVVGSFSHQLSMWVTGHEGHFVDQRWITVVLVLGAAATALLGAHCRLSIRLALASLPIAYGGAYALLALTPPAPDLSIAERRVAAFDHARFSSATWADWETIARWVKARGGKLDFQKPRALFDRTIEKDGKPNPYILGSAVRTGALTPDEAAPFLAWEHAAYSSKQLFDDFYRERPISSLAQMDWIIRVLVATRRTSREQVDILERRLLLSWPEPTTFRCLSDMNRIIGLLDAIGRPIDQDAHRESVLAALRLHWVSEATFLRPSGGFDNNGEGSYANERSTLHAVRLMMRFGVPTDIDLLRVRSYLRYRANPALPGLARNGWQWRAAIAHDELDRNLEQETGGVLRWFVTERLLIGSILLVLLCLYAVVRAPVDAPASPFVRP